MTSLKSVLDGFSFQVSRVESSESTSLIHLWRSSITTIHSVVGLWHNDNFCCIFKHATTEPSVGSAIPTIITTHRQSKGRMEISDPSQPSEETPLVGDSESPASTATGTSVGATSVREAEAAAPWPLTAGHPSNWRCPVCRRGHQEPEVWSL